MPATEQYWRPLSTMHKVFAGSALLLLVATLVMMAFDQNREWRRYQLESEEIKTEQLEAERASITTSGYEAELQRLNEGIQQSQASLEGKKDELERLESEVQALNGDVELRERQVKFKNAEVGKLRADRDIQVRDNVAAAEQAATQQTYETLLSEAGAMTVELDAVKSRRETVKAELAVLKEAETSARAALTKYQEDVQRISDQIEQLKPSAWLSAVKRNIKRWPIINGFNPEIRIIQDWLPDLKQQLGMAKVARFDRCRSCHTQIDQFAAGNLPKFPPADGKGSGFPNPFCSHPQANVYVSDTSPHPLNKFGCTSCHEGDGSGTSFRAAEHTPADPIEALKWKEEHHWHSNHFWEYPQHSSAFIESGCLKCHPSVTELGVNPEFGATAPKLYDGYTLIQELGCFGCHEINGYDGTRVIGPDLRLEPQTAEEAERIAADPNQVAGTMRKVGPSLRHVGYKTTPEFISYWTENPQRFRPETRMPRFFDLSNQTDHLAHLLQPVELAGISAFLMDRTQELKLDTPVEGYAPDAERGKVQFSRRGCLACHSHNDPEFAGIHQDFGPNLTNVRDKLRPGAEGFNWLYTWIRNPERHHARTRMPYLFLTPEGEGDAYVDPAADIAAYLLEGETTAIPATEMPGAYSGIAGAEKSGDDAGVVIGEVLPGSPATRAVLADEAAPAPLDPLLIEGDVLLSWNGESLTSAAQLADLERSTPPGTRVTLVRARGNVEVDVAVVISTPLEDLARLFLSKQMTADEANATLAGGALVKRQGTAAEDGTIAFSFVPVPTSQIKGDEIELARQANDPEQISPEERQRRLLLYVGRRTVSRYGCYGCHDIAGFEEARPIGTALQDWGRKDTSKLAPEHIEEYLHHHGEPDGSSTYEAVAEIVNPANADKLTHEQRMKAYFFESLAHHGRAGFLWQKLREPRSYDYEKTETKGWDERLRMPKFPVNDQQIESIATFILGLVADPPTSQYVYRPEGAALARIEGEKLLGKFNCTACHMVEMPGIRYETDLHEVIGMTRSELTDWFASHAEAIAAGELTQETIRDGGAEPADFAEPLTTFVKNAEQLLAGRLPGVEDVTTGFVPHLAQLALAGGATTDKRAAAINAFFSAYPELMLADPIDPADLPETVPMAIKLKPPVRRGAPITSSSGRGSIEIHGLVFAAPDPEETDPEFREYAFELWENAEIGGRYKLAGVNSRYIVPESAVQEHVAGRGGDFTEWLAPRLREELTGGDTDKARQAGVPPLYKEGVKVQTPWLYRFLKNPDQLRFTTVLRMPRFNMSDAEAQTLANYFSAVDGVPFPYQRIPEQEPAYLAERDADFHADFGDESTSYLQESWTTLNTPLCIKCHAVAGRPYQGTDPTKDIRGPNLDRVQQRLRPEYLSLWVRKPKAFLAYTSMPTNFPRNQEQFPDLFHANAQWQSQAIVDALLNYYNLLEQYGVTSYVPPEGQAPAEQPTEAAASTE
ncbi:MAG: c-type cytochrome, partial [Planctomycetaceae bacterium]|nr:c-type cytochrome [Planctomycetaceae bacterium]